MYRTRPMTRDEALLEAVRKADEHEIGFSTPDWLRMVKENLRSAGFAIVPVEPIRGMQIAGRAALGGTSTVLACNVYSAMIAAYEKEQGDD